VVELLYSDHSAGPEYAVSLTQAANWLPQITQYSRDEDSIERSVFKRQPIDVRRLKSNVRNVAIGSILAGEGHVQGFDLGSHNLPRRNQFGKAESDRSGTTATIE
jgi:hypothetical protein